MPEYSGMAPFSIFNSPSNPDKLDFSSTSLITLFLFQDKGSDSFFPKFTFFLFLSLEETGLVIIGDF